MNELGARIIVGSAALSLVTTVLVTLLIVYRIVRLGGGRRYRAVIGIIAESSALYSVALIIYFAFVLSPTVSDIVPRMVLTQVAVRSLKLPEGTKSLIMATDIYFFRVSPQR